MKNEIHSFSKNIWNNKTQTILCPYKEGKGRWKIRRKKIENRKRGSWFTWRKLGGWYFLWVPDKTDCRKRDNIYHRAPFRLVNINMYFVMQGKLWFIYDPGCSLVAREKVSSLYIVKPVIVSVMIINKLYAYNRYTAHESPLFNIILYQNMYQLLSLYLSVWG